MQFIKMSVLQEPPEWEVIFSLSSFLTLLFTILFPPTSLVPLVVDEAGGGQQQRERQAHEAHATQHAGQQRVRDAREAGHLVTLHPCVTSLRQVR